MYVLTTDVKSYSTGQTVPKGTALVGVYSDAHKPGHVLAMASFAGERHKLSMPETAMEWSSEPRAGN
jgi:hypothetical protein